MKSRLPTASEIAALVAYLPRLYEAGFEPVVRWEGGEWDQDGVMHLPWPEYNPVVTDFFRQLGADCWLDYDYDPNVAGPMLQADGLVEQATLEQVKAMLTYCVRGERFSDGHWEEMIEEGHIRRLLTRLVQLQEDSS